MLEKVMDTNNNYVRYVYNKDQNQIYPYEIIYTGNGSTDGPMTITFATSTRPDPTESYKSDFLVDTNYRISQIEAYVSGNLVRQYNLSYTTGNNGFRSILSGIQENGWDDNSVEASEPAMTFGYVDATSSFVTQNGVDGPAYVVAQSSGNGINDINTFYLDDYTDALGGVIYKGGGGTPTDLSPVPGAWSDGPNTNPTYGPDEYGVRYVDLNGSGKADVVEGIWNYTTSTSTDGRGLNNYATSTGYAWTATSTYNGVIPAFVDEGSADLFATTGIFGNIDGTGLPSYVEDVYNYSTGEGAYLANGSAWNAATTTIFQAAEPMPAASYNYDFRGSSI